MNSRVVSSERMVFGLAGVGGLARETMPILEATALREFGPTGTDRVFFVDIQPSNETINGHAVLSEDEFFALGHERKFFNVATADSRLRQRIVELWSRHGVEPLTLRASSSEVMATAQIGSGAILAGFTSITANASIGKYFQANLYSYVAHDCVIGDFVTFAPNVHCNGNVHIRDHAYIGAGAVIRQGTPEHPLVIGEGAVVGMGAVVTKDVAPGVTVVGNPARPMER